jgi:hypothetical protein
MTKVNRVQGEAFPVGRQTPPTKVQISVAQLLHNIKVYDKAAFDMYALSHEDGSKATAEEAQEYFQTLLNDGVERIG